MKALRLSLILVVLFGLGYPLVTVGLSQLLFSSQANGSIIYNDQKQAIGSELIGQSFQDPKYFHGRISSVEYDGASSGSKNYAPSNKEMIERTQKAAAEYLKQHPGATLQDVPMDLITNSGSGLDPHITPEAAQFQIPRVAQATKLSEDDLRKLVTKHTEGRSLGIFGEPRVNVLKLNTDLQDQLR